MKKIVKILLGILVCTVSLATTFAYFYTHSQTINVFETEDYTFKINTNGGSFSNNNVVVENNTISFPNPVKKGYDFLGYSNSQDGNVIYPAASKIDVGLINNKLIHAIWDINTYDITYNLNGGTATNLKEKYTVEDSFSLVTPIKEGHTFLGWTGSNGSTPQTEVVVPKGTTDSKSYEANWQINSYSVDVNPIVVNTSHDSGMGGFTFDVYVNGTLIADDVIDWNQDVPYGSNVRVVANNKDGYSLSNEDTNGIVGTNGLVFNPTWNINTYNITYNTNGGSAVENRNYNIETPTFTLPIPKRTGYTFKGWTGSNGLIPQSIVSINKGTFGNKNFLANWDKINAKATGVTIYAYRSQDYGNSYSQWANGPWGKYYTDSVRISDVGTWDLVVSNNYVELKGTTVVISDYRCYKLEVYAGNNGRNGEFLGFDTECTVNENHNTTSKAYLKVGW